MGGGYATISKRQLLPQAMGEIAVRFRPGALGLGDDGRLAFVRVFADAWVQGYVCQQFDVQFGTLFRDALGPEDGMCAGTCWTCECRHVLHHAQDLAHTVS